MLSLSARRPSWRTVAAVAAGVALLVALDVARRRGYLPALVVLGGMLGSAGAATYLIWHASPTWLLTLALVTAPIAGYWEQLGIPGKLSPDRLLLIGAVVTVLLRGPAIRQRRQLPRAPAHLVLVLASLYAIGSAIVAGTLLRNAPFFKLFEAYGVLLFLVFYVAPAAFATPRQRQVLLTALVVLGGYLGLTALFETIHLHQLVFPRYINDPTVGIHFGRARGPFAEAVTNGTALFTCGAAAVLAFGLWRRTWARAAAAAVAILCFGGILFTLERSVWLGAVVAGVVTVLAIPLLRRLAVPILLAGALIGGGAYLVAPREQVQQRATDSQTVWDRKNLDLAAVRMIMDRPLVGFGWSRFADASVNGDYFRLSSTYPLTAAGAEDHNEFLSHGAELGLVGLSLWLLGIGLAVVGALRAPMPDPDLRGWKALLVAYAVFYVVVSNFVPPQLFPNLLLWLFAGVLWSGRIPRRDPLIA